VRVEVPQLRQAVHRTSIEWCDYAVGSFVEFVAPDGDVIRNACVKVSSGCANCYAEQVGLRWKKGRAYTKGEMAALTPRLDEGALAHMLRFRPKPPKGETTFKGGSARPRVFLGDMTDPFGEWVEDAWLDRVFAVMALRPDVDWLLLTKRPERMAAYLTRRTLMYLGDTEEAAWANRRVYADDLPNESAASLALTRRLEREGLPNLKRAEGAGWAANVWLGTSVEDQQRADERIPHLLRCPAAVRFLSCEPLLGRVELRMRRESPCSHTCFNHVTHPCERCGYQAGRLPINWVIVGGESGRGARPCNVEWVRSIKDQCAGAGVACFNKQLGAHVIDRNDAGFDADECSVLDEKTGEWKTYCETAWPSTVCVEHDCGPVYQGAPVRVHLSNAKGGDPEEWPEDLRVRKWPGTHQGSGIGDQASGRDAAETKEGTPCS